MVTIPVQQTRHKSRGHPCLGAHKSPLGSVPRRISYQAHHFSYKYPTPGHQVCLKNKASSPRLNLYLLQRFNLVLPPLLLKASQVTSFNLVLQGNISWFRLLKGFLYTKKVIAQYHPLALRYFLMRSHYRSSLNYSRSQFYSQLEKVHVDVYYIYQVIQRLLFQWSVASIGGAMETNAGAIATLGPALAKNAGIGRLEFAAAVALKWKFKDVDVTVLLLWWMKF